MSLLTLRYELHEPLGDGAMGTVYRATDRLNNSQVALKQIRFLESRFLLGLGVHETKAEAMRLALANEFQILAGLRHPNIISVLDYGFDKNRQPFFTMDLLEEAQTIVAAALNQPLETQIDLLGQLLQALVYLHRRRVLHRDLKPTNVLVSHNRVRVLDFGLSSPLETAQGAPGTILYIDPYVLQNNQAIEASDLYAVGVIAYEIWGGTTPFSGNDLNSILYRDPDMTPLQVPPPLVEFVACLLEKEPEKRFPNAIIALTAMREAVGLHSTTETARIRDSFLQAARFVGRKKELEHLETALEAGRKGQGSAWLIGGESGIGKSRLLDEIRIRALVSGMQVLRGESMESSGLSYQLWLKPLRRLCLSIEISDLEAGILKTLLPDLDHLLQQPIPAPPPLGVHAAQQRLILTITSLFYKAASLGPSIVLLMDDLQWAGESLEPLKWLLRTIQKVPIILIGTYRNDEYPEIPNILPQMQLLQLERLVPDEIKSLSVSMLGKVGNNPQVLGLLQRETEGNIFFLVETVRALAEEAGGLGTIGQKTLPTMVFTGGINQILKRRLERVPSHSRLILKTAAIHGRDLDLNVLKTIYPKSDLEKWLLICANAAVLEIQEERWRFTHEKLRQHLIANLSELEKPDLYQKLAEAIEIVYKGSEQYAGALTHYWELAGDITKAAYYAHVAGDQAAKQFANREALYFLSRALDFMTENQYHTRFHLLISREKVFDLLGYRQQQKNDLENLSTLADQSNNPSWRAQVAVQYAYFYEKIARYPEALQAVLQSIDLADQEGDLPLKTAGFVQLGRLQWRQANYRESTKTLKQALTWFDKQPELLDLKGEALRNLGIPYMYQGMVNEASDYFTQAKDIYISTGNKVGQSIALNNIGYLALGNGDYEAAKTYLEQALAIHHQIDEPISQALVMHNLSEVFRFLGNYEEALDLANKALEIRQKSQDLRGESASLNQLSHIHYDLEAYSESLSYAQKALKITDQAGDLRTKGYALTNIGRCLLKIRQLPEAQIYFQQAFELRRTLGQSSLAEESLAGLAQTYMLMGQLSNALEVVEDILKALAANPLVDFLVDPMRVHLACYEVLFKMKDLRAEKVLEGAYLFLQARAQKITDKQLMTMYLEQVAVNQLVITLWKTSQNMA